MLTRDQVELIQQEIDGANTPVASAALRSLLEQNPEARAYAAELRRVSGAFARVGERQSPSHLRQSILDALPQPVRASPGGNEHEDREPCCAGTCGGQSQGKPEGCRPG